MVQAHVNGLTVGVALASVAVTIIGELYIMRPLFSHRMRKHEHRSALTTLVMLFTGMGLMPVIYSIGFFFILLYPEVEHLVDPVLHGCEAIALLLFWHILVVLAGGRERAAMCVDTSPQGPVCVVMPIVCGNAEFCRFRDGAAALRFWHASVAQWIVLSPCLRLVAQNDMRAVRLSSIPVQVVGLGFLLRALLDTHRGTRHAAPRHARPDAQFVVMKIIVLVLLVQTSTYALGWPPPEGAPDGVTRAFAVLTLLEMAVFSITFAWAFGPQALWWALDQTPLTHALTEAFEDGTRATARTSIGGYNPLERAVANTEPA